MDRAVAPRQTGDTEAPAPVRKQPNVCFDRFGSGSDSITLMGLLRSNSGLGQAARASFRALEHLNRPFSVLDTTDQYLSKNTTDPGLDRHPFGAFGELNLIHANAAEFAAPLGLFHHQTRRQVQCRYVVLGGRNVAGGVAPGFRQGR